MTDLGSAMKGVILTDSGTALSTPIRAGGESPSDSRGALPTVASVAAIASAHGEAGDNLVADAQSSGPPERSHPILPRRKSILHPPSSRPSMHPSSTTSVIPRTAGAPAYGDGWPSTTREESGAGPSSAPSAAATQAPASVWNLEDEENLPSPFAKRNINFSAYGRVQASTSVATSGSLPAVSTLSSMGKTLGSLANKPRSSMISKALKASGEAQRALARRQAEGKAGIS
jgi:hypothetical protein